MKSILEQIEKNKSTSSKPQNKDIGLDALVMQEVMNGALYFLRGVYESYCYFNDQKPLEPEEFTKKIDGLDPNIDLSKHDQEDHIVQFLTWYFEDFK